MAFAKRRQARLFETVIIALLLCCAFGEEITINSCADYQQKTAAFSETGENTLHIRKLDDIMRYSCTIQVKSLSDPQTNTVIIHASELNMTLSWLFNDKSLMIQAAAGHSLSVVYSTVSRFILEIGGTENNVEFVVGSLATETVIQFPTYSLDETRNTLTVVGGGRGVLATGTIQEVSIGIFESNSYPFRYFESVLGLSGDVGRVLIDTASAENAPKQHFILGENCVYETYRPPKDVTPVSDWLQALFTQNGLVYSDCSLIYNPQADQSLQIRTGGADDIVEAEHFGMKTTLEMGGGADNVTWLSPLEGISLSVDLGEGNDEIMIHDSGPVFLNPGDDNDVDTVTLMFDDVPPSVNQFKITPIGPHSNSVMTGINWLPEDLFLIKTESTSISSSITPSFSIPGTNIVYDMSDDLTYKVSACKPDAYIVFNTHSTTNPDYRAHNTRLELQFTQTDSPCLISYVGSEDLNTTAAILVPDNVYEMPKTVGFRSSFESAYTGYSTLGSAVLRTENIDHLEYIMPAAPSESGTITVDGNPALSDLILVMDPYAEWKVRLNTINNTVVVLNGTTIVSDLAFASGHTMLLHASGFNSKTTVNVPDSAESVQIVDGCLNIKGISPNNNLTDWMMDKLSVFNVSVNPNRKCSVDMINVSSLDVINVQHIDVSDLRKSNIRSIIAESAGVLSVTLEPSDLVNTSRKWSSLQLNNVFGSVSVDYSDIKDSFEFHAIAANRTDITLGSPMLEDESKIFVTCSNTTTFYNWDFSALPITTPNYRASVNASLGDFCWAMFTNSINANQDVLPSIKFAEGVNVWIYTGLTNASSVPEFRRRVNLVAKNTYRDKYIHGMYVISDVDNPKVRLLQLDWEASKTELLEMWVTDSVNTTCYVDSDMVDIVPYWLFFKSNSRLSFPDQKEPVFFRESITTLFSYDDRLITLKRKELLTGSDSDYEALFGSGSGDGVESVGHCFDPCSHCSAGYWGEVDISDRPCDTRYCRSTCNATNPRIFLTQLDGTFSLGCGTPAWDGHVNDTCAFVLGDVGADQIIPHPSHGVQGFVAFIIAMSAFLTLVGASSTITFLIKLIRDRDTSEGLISWWAKSVFRDVLSDQFSWAPIVMTASLAEVKDFDYSDWGNDVMAIMQMVKHFVLDWFVPCDYLGRPVWYSPPLFLFWVATIITIMLRVAIIVIWIVRKCTEKPVGGVLLDNILLPVLSVFTTLGLTFFPYACYSLAFFESDIEPGYVSLVFAVLLLLCQPIGLSFVKYNIGIVSSLCLTVIPGVMCCLSGYGIPVHGLLALGIVFVFIYSFSDPYVLHSSFFHKATGLEGFLKFCPLITIGIRAGSSVCGIIFLILLNFSLNSSLSSLAAFFWFLWIIIPWFSVITLTFTSLAIPLDGKENEGSKVEKGKEEEKEEKKEEKKEEEKEEEKKEKEDKKEEDKKEEDKKEKKDKKHKKHKGHKHDKKDKDGCELEELAVK